MATNTSNFLSIRTVQSRTLLVTRFSFGPVSFDQTISTIYSIYLAEGWQIDDWQLSVGLVVEIQQTSAKIIASTWLESVEEYGTGSTDAEAIRDLLLSLLDYRESLESREDQLGESTLRDLTYLRRLVQRR